MRVIHLVSQNSGGAGRATIRLHQALLESGIDSLVITQNKTSDAPKVIRLAKSKTEKIAEKLRPAINNLPLAFYKNRQKEIFSPDFFLFPPKNAPLLKMLKELKPDIIHLHWIAAGFINAKDLVEISCLAPMMWSLCDCAPYTGGCHYVADGCAGVEAECQKCPLLGSKLTHDLSYFTFKNKNRAYGRIKNLTINAKSRWILEDSQKSLLFSGKNFKFINLPNPIDTSIYCPVDKKSAKELLKLPASKKIIGFGAVDATGSRRKGYAELKKALEILKNSLKDEVILLIFGSNGEDSIAPDIKTHFLGHISDDISLRLLYSACDCVVMPSHAESFGNVALEAIACNTPVAAFDATGLKDIIIHKENGYLAKAFEPSDLARAILWCLENKNEEIYKSAMKFDSKIISKRFVEQYAAMLGGGGGN